MKNNSYLILTFLLFWSVFSSAQSLTRGDIAFVQYNADGVDNFAFVCLTDIPAGVTIHFTDNEPINLQGGEGTISWTTSATINCGTVVTIDYNPSESTGQASVSESNSLNFNGDGDGLWAYCGDALSPIYISAIGNDGSVMNEINTAAEGDIIGTNLTVGINALGLSEIDNCIYNGAVLSGSQEELRIAINDPNNWTGSNTVTQTFTGGFTISECSSGTTVPDTPTISSIVNGENQVSVYFYPGADGGSPITDFQYSTNGGSSFTSMGSTSSPFVITGLTNGVNYDIQIKAINAIGESNATASTTGSPYENVITLSTLGVAQNEDFNTLASSGTSNILALGWFINEIGTSSNDTYSANTGSSSAGNTYSYGTDSDRALGGLYSGSVNPSWGAKIKNDMGVVLNNLTISYTGETWRVGNASRSDQINFEYSLDATSIGDGTWTSFDDLNYANPGQAVDNGSLQHSEAISNTISGLSIANGGYIWIRWTDQNSDGADDGMAIDDFSISASCPVGNTVTSHDNIIRGNEITWTYDGADFDSYEFQWNGTGGSWQALTTNNPGSWGACCPSIGIGTLYIRAKTSCSSTNDYSNVVTTYWGDCYAADISATMDGTSISEGGSMTINSTVSWTWPHDGSGVNNGAPNEGGGSGHALGYFWDSDPANPDDYAYAWNTNPQQWNDFNGGFFTTTDRKLYVKARSTGDNSCTNYSNSYYITLKKPEITASTSSINLTACSGYNGNSESFDVSGSYIKNSDGITINAPADFEISQDNSTFSSSINLLPTDGTVSTTTIYTRMTSSASGTPSGSITCSATSAIDQNISLSGTITSAPVITSGDFTGSSTCGVSEYAVTLVNSLSGSWTENITGSTFFDPTQGSQTFTSFPAGFNNDIIMTWTENQGACSGNTNAVSIRFNQPVVSGSMDTDSWTWGGVSSTEWTNGTNWYKWDGSKWAVQSSSYPDAGSKIYVLPTTGVCVNNTLNNTASSIGDLNIQGGSFDLGSTNTSITGNITNDGTMQGGTGTVTLSGSTDQTISGTGTINFNNLTVNKSSGSAIISTQTDIRNTLTMTKGNIVNSQPVVLGVNSSNPGTLSHASGIVTGKLRRYFANATGSTFFPVGTSSNLRDVTINFTQVPGTDEYLTVSYVAGAPTLGGSDGSYSGLPLVTGDNQLIQNYSADGHWNIDPTGGLYESTEINSAAYEITLRCKALTVQPTDVSKVRIIKSAGSENSSLDHATWTGLDLLSSSGSAADFTITASATGFSKFGAGSDDGNALPVELISFNGSCNNGGVDLTWQTASEYNSSYFDIEQSRDGNHWDVIYSIDAAGQSSELIEYKYTDEHAQGQYNYYRLTQVDIDGTSKTYNAINVSCSQNHPFVLSTYPNPSSNEFSIYVNSPKEYKNSFLRIYNFMGSIVLRKEIEIAEGINIFYLNEKIKSGLYSVEIEMNKNHISKKHIIR